MRGSLPEDPLQCGGGLGVARGELACKRRHPRVQRADVLVQLGEQPALVSPFGGPPGRGVDAKGGIVSHADPPLDDRPHHERPMPMASSLNFTWAAVVASA